MKRYTAIVCILALLCLSCANMSQAIASTTSPQAASESTTPITTQIEIDGKPDDWSDRNILLADPIGDNAEGYLDFRLGYAFVNHNALYIMVTVIDNTAPFVLFDMHFQVDNRHIQITFDPNNIYEPEILDWSSGRGELIGYATYSAFAYDDAFEARFDLRDLGNPEKIEISNFMAMAQLPGTGWGACDSWRPSSPPVVDEYDTAMAMKEEQYIYADLWDLKDGWVGQAILKSKIGNNAAIVTSQDGTVYMKEWGAESGISVIDTQTLTVTRLFDIPTTNSVNDIVGGQDDTAYVNVGPDIRLVHSDGSYSIWATFTDACVAAYTPDGRILGKSNDCSVLYELFPDGSKKKIAGNFHNIYEVAVMDDGTIIVYEWDTGNIVRLKTDGNRKILVSGVSPYDFVNFDVDTDGQLYYNACSAHGLKRLNVNSGKVTDIVLRLNETIWNPNDFAFIRPGEIVLGGDQFSIANINTGDSQLLIPNIAATYAVDIGPDGALYVGTFSYGNQVPAQILRLADDGVPSVYLDNLEGAIDFIDFTQQGDLYFSTVYDHKIHLFYVAKDQMLPVEIPNALQESIMSMTVNPNNNNLLISQSRGAPLLEYSPEGLVQTYAVSIPWDAHEYRIDYAPDGTLYAFIGQADDQSSAARIVRIDLDEKTCIDISQLPFNAAAALCVLSVDAEGSIWLLYNPESAIYKITPDGEIDLYASNLPIDAPAIVAGSSGDVYFTSASGIFHLYQE